MVFMTNVTNRESRSRDSAITLSRKATTGNVKSVIELDKHTFHVTSYFDKKTTLADLLFTAAGENLFNNPFLAGDITTHARYNNK